MSAMWKNGENQSGVGLTILRDIVSTKPQNDGEPSRPVRMNSTGTRVLRVVSVDASQFFDE
ncbi:MAG: hypothetical protein LIQ31_11205 [Planctomycetes bacterium]|nr:hypothetical protein [Planctomycetota bacterium]